MPPVTAPLSVHLERLRRHYDVAVRTYDHVSLLDLSHALRMWADLKPALASRAPSSSKTIALKTASPPRPLMKAIRDVPYVVAYMPDGVDTFACDGDFLGGDGAFIGNGDFHVGARVKRIEGGGLKISSVEVIKGRSLIEGGEMSQGVKRSPSITRCNFVGWMGAEAVRLQQLGADGHLHRIALAREQVIRRVANLLDGSHPADAANTPAIGSADQAVEYLMGLRPGALPLPYFLLLKIAQDLLLHAPKWVEEEARAR